MIIYCAERAGISAARSSPHPNLGKASAVWTLGPFAGDSITVTQ